MATIPNLRFTEDLPEGAQIMGEGRNTRGVNKEETAKALRANKGKWSLIYESSNHGVASDWRKKPGFEVATKPHDNQEGVPTGSRRYKIWIRFVGVPGQPDEPEVEAPQTSIVESGLPDQTAGVVAPQLPPTSAPAPIPQVPVEKPQTAFQKAFVESAQPEIMD